MSLSAMSTSSLFMHVCSILAMLALAPDRLLQIVLVLYQGPERKVQLGLGKEWQLLKHPGLLWQTYDTTQGGRPNGKCCCETSSLAKCTLIFPRETIFSNGLLPIYPIVLCLGISTIFQLGTEIENNTFSCTLFPLPQLDAWRCMQHTVRFAYVLLGYAHFITQKTYSRNITKCLKNRTDKTNTLIWQRSVKYQNEQRWLWSHFPTPLFLLSKYCS